MEEVEDIIPDNIDTITEEFPEEVEVIPEPEPLKRATNILKDTITCEGCGKSLSLHAYKYSHKCKARAPDEPPKEPKEVKQVKQDDAKLTQLTAALKDFKPARKSKPSMSDAQSQRPIRQKQ